MNASLDNKYIVVKRHVHVCTARPNSNSIADVPNFSLSVFISLVHNVLLLKLCHSVNIALHNV